jgi:hypothetical protein
MLFEPLLQIAPIMFRIQTTHISLRKKLLVSPSLIPQINKILTN